MAWAKKCSRTLLYTDPRVIQKGIVSCCHINGCKTYRDGRGIIVSFRRSNSLVCSVIMLKSVVRSPVNITGMHELRGGGVSARSFSDTTLRLRHNHPWVSINMNMQWEISTQISTVLLSDMQQMLQIEPLIPYDFISRFQNLKDKDNLRDLTQIKICISISLYIQQRTFPLLSLSVLDYW